MLRKTSHPSCPIIQEDYLSKERAEIRLFRQTARAQEGRRRDWGCVELFLVFDTLSNSRLSLLRKCDGKKLALLTPRIPSLTIILNFNREVSEPQCCWNCNMLVFGLFLYPLWTVENNCIVRYSTDEQSKAKTILLVRWLKLSLLRLHWTFSFPPASPNTHTHK